MIEYERAFVNDKIAWSEGSRIPTAQNRVEGYPKERSRVMWCRGCLKRCKYTYRIGLRAYTFFVRANVGPRPLDPTGKKTGHSGPETAASVDMWKLLAGRLWEVSDGNECLREPDQKAPEKTGKYFLVKEGEHVQLIQKLYKTEIVEFVRDRLKEINWIFGVPEDGAVKLRLIIDAPRTNCDFVEPEYPKHPHPRLIWLLEKAEKEIYVEKLDIDYSITVCTYLDTYRHNSASRRFISEKTGKLLTASSDRTHRALSYSNDLTSNTWRTFVLQSVSGWETWAKRAYLKYIFGRYIEDFFVLGIDSIKRCGHRTALGEHLCGQGYRRNYRRASDPKEIRRLKSLN